MMTAVMKTITHKIINLHEPGEVRTSQQLEQTGHHIFYVSAVHPRHLLGGLWDEEQYQGAWMENFRVITRVGSESHVFEAPGVIVDDPSRLARWVLENLLRGSRPASIQDALDRSTAKTWALVA